MDLGAWQATVHRAAKRVRHDLVTKQQKQEQDNNNVTAKEMKHFNTLS